MKRIRPGLLLSALALVHLACGGGAATFNNNDSGQTTVAHPGEELDIQISSIGNQGDPTVSSSAVEYEGNVLVGPETPGGPTLRYKFRAVSAGQATITIPFENPGNPPPFTLNVTVD